jgi:hypothetical protein
MGGEHDDDMDLEVNDGLTGEFEHYALVQEDLEQREADDAARKRARESREALQKTTDGDVEEV